MLLVNGRNGRIWGVNIWFQGKISAVNFFLPECSAMKLAVSDRSQWPIHVRGSRYDMSARIPTENRRWAQYHDQQSLICLVLSISRKKSGSAWQGICKRKRISNGRVWDLSQDRRPRQKKQCTIGHIVTMLCSTAIAARRCGLKP